MGKPPKSISAQLKGTRAIAGVFGVSRDTVRRWAAEGAPIFFVGRKHQANYTRLCLWLEEQYPSVAKPCQRTLSGP